MSTKGLNRVLRILIAAASLAAPAVKAENWFIKDGTEKPDAKPLRVYGLVQPTFQADFSDKLEGLGGAEAQHNGEHSAYSSIPPGQSSTSSFYLFRVRLGVRGLIEPKINYEVVGEYGVNALTTKAQNDFNVELAEGSVTLNHIPGVRVRMGLFKVPGPEEAMRTAIDYVNFTNVTFRLINYQPVERNPNVSSLKGVPADAKTGVRAFRDTGVQLFDAFRFGQQEFTYAAMLANGSSLNQIDDNRNKAVYGRLQWSWIFDDTQDHYYDTARQDLSLFGWYQRGDQAFDDKNYKAVRQGVGFSYVKQPYHLTAEYMWGEGMIVLSSSFRNEPYLVFPESENEGRGWYVDAGMFVTRNIALEARYDVLELLPNDRQMETTFKTTTLGLQYYFSKRNRIALNYEFRDYDLAAVPVSAEFANNTRQLNRSLDDRLAIQYTLRF